ncbi:hypothetical protein [Mesorhizobium wenxiniae]|uniref:hypothetical protein n=1 Tax=Mesorhizobium wenxiniae TaxID=2014805 RepID=UPI0013FE2BF7|nr:hypothetical protein [Mesorhizobium wenxiniae]
MTATIAIVDLPDFSCGQISLVIECSKNRTEIPDPIAMGSRACGGHHRWVDGLRA